MYAQETYVPPVTNMVFRIMILSSTAFVLQILALLLFQQVPYGDLSLHFGSDFHPAQLFTHLFLRSVSLNGLFSLFIDCCLLWFFGSDLERIWGSHNFLRFFYAGLIGGALLTALIALPLLPNQVVLSGFGAGLAATMVAYAIIWPDRQILLYFVIPVRMKWVVIFLLFVRALFGSTGSFLQYSGGALAGALFIYYYAKVGSKESTKTGKGSPVSQLKEYLRKRRLRKKQEVIQQRIHMKEEVDRLLEKISKEGMDSLTRKEKAFLDRASKEF